LYFPTYQHGAIKRGDEEDEDEDEDEEDGDEDEKKGLM
jgi:hypothetical protein